MAQSNDLTLTAKVVIAHEARIAALESGSKNPGGGGTADPEQPGTVTGLGDGPYPGKGQTYRDTQMLYQNATGIGPGTLQLEKPVEDSDDKDLYDGLTINIALQKTPLITGNKGTPSTINVATGTAKKNSTFILKSGLPINMSLKNLAHDQTVVVHKTTFSLDGIGEALGNTVVPPTMTFQLQTNSQYDSLVFTATQGHDYDGQQNGALYDILITSIVGYKIGDALDMLPVGKVLWSGSQYGTAIALDSVLAADWSNVPNGIRLVQSGSFAPMINMGIWNTQGQDLTITLTKQQLINGSVIKWLAKDLWGPKFWDSSHPNVTGGISYTPADAAISLTVNSNSLDISRMGLANFDGNADHVFESAVFKSVTVF